MQPFPVHRSVKGRRAFALVVTLLILSLLVIVAVSYLSSMTAERQTADAYDAKASAEQAAQTGVDTATAMLAECFRDFPDSATVWDAAQTLNGGAPYDASVIVGGTNNEGTSLYLRAVPSANDSSAYAVALPHGNLNAADGTPYPSNDPAGNDPNNPACKTFVLPLISGVLNGQARLVSAGGANPPATVIFSKKMNLNVSDSTVQNWTDLNVRRFGKSPAYPNGDTQGFIGSPPGWNGVGPKPARAYWVNLKGSNGLVTGRYAFWIDDESFRLNTSVAGPSAAALTADPAAAPPQQPPDNTSQPLDPATGKPRSLQPSDLMLLGTLSAINYTGSENDANASNDTSRLMAVRTSFPGKFFPDPLAFGHAYDTDPHPLSATTVGLIDTVRYLTTNQSGALNLSRHGSQRLNLNTAIFTPSATSTPAAVTTAIQRQVNELVQTLEFHLPNFGERFYRTNSNVLNDATQVPGSPFNAPTEAPVSTQSNGAPTTDSSNSQIYYYKVAANLRDYVDTDCQPTMIGIGGVVMPGPMNGTLETTGANEVWAQGKESTPYIQEVAVRYRPTVTPNADYQSSYHFSIYVDYYIEVWNMSDRDIAASQMNSPAIFVRDQQTWDTYYPRDSLVPDSGTGLPGKNLTPDDMQIGLVTGITDPSGNPVSGGVVFRAGTVTVITTDPQCSSYTYIERPSGGSSGPAGKTNHPSAKIPILSPPDPTKTNVFVCPVTAGSRLYTGKIIPYNSAATRASSVGIQLGQPFEGTSPYTSTTPFPSTEISLVNSQGYFDVVRGAITKTGACGYHIYVKANNTNFSQGGFSDYSYGSSLMGNVADTGGGPLPDSEVATTSQLGDPRTNNEQLKVNVANLTSDGTRFMASTRTLGSPNYPDLAPDSTASGEGWPDYYKFPTATPANSLSPDATSAPAVISGSLTTDGPLTSIGQLGDVFDPARAPGGDINYSHGGGRTFKIGQHDDLYSDDATTNIPTTVVEGNATFPTNTADNVSASTGWASWRLTDIFDVADPIQLPGRINVNGIVRDNGAALLSSLQGFVFQPKTTSGTSDPIIHGDPLLNPGTPPTQTPLDTSSTTSGFSQIMAQMKQRLNANTTAEVKPFFERGEFGELGYSSSNPASNLPLFGMNAASMSTALIGVDMNKVTDHSREELFRRLAEMICTRGNTFTIYVAGQSMLQTIANGPMKITGTQRMRVTFRLVPKAKDSSGAWVDFHPGYVTKNSAGFLNTSDGVIDHFNTIDPTNVSEPATSSGQIGVVPRYAKPDRYDAQVLQVTSY